jgi:SAM-dependent methyltransferase
MSRDETSGPRLYRDLAHWWPLLSPPEEYEEEATFYRNALLETAEGSVRTVLELGSGGGNNASHLKQHFEMTLVDQSPGMLELSRALNPECEHLEGDMRSVRLPRTFDAVFVHDAICYMTTKEELAQVFATARAHCRPGGAAVFAPDFVKENFFEGTDIGGEDGDDRALRYLEWTHDPDPTDTSYMVDFAYMLKEGGSVRVEHDRHIEGLFERRTWLELLEAQGFDARAVPFEDSDGRTWEVFVCFAGKAESTREGRG